MKIKVLNNQYIITSDSRQYMLAQDTGRKDKDGKPILEYLGYYHKIDNLLNALMIREPKFSKAQSFDTYIKDVKKAEKDIKKIANALAQLIGNEAEFKKLIDKN